MKTVTLTRGPSTNDGTFGSLTVDGHTFLTGELPWRENERGKSCVPTGTYLCIWANHPKRGFCYELVDVPDRSAVLIHSGNFCGDVNAGLRADFRGCIGLGLAFGNMEGQKVILQSKAAVEMFNKLMRTQNFELEIK